MPGRIQEIVEASSFACHATVDYDDAKPNHERQCAGFMIYQLANDGPTQMMQVADRLGLRIDLDELAAQAHEGNVITDLSELIAMNE